MASSIFDEKTQSKLSDAPAKIDFSSANSIVDDNNADFYSTYRENWFTAKPYGFTISLSANESYTVFLPISPSNLTISTKFATNIVPTLYGTVEEHSDVRYFDITIQGTTGFAPKYVKPKLTSYRESQVDASTTGGRASFPIGSNILGGFFSKTLGALNQIKTKALDAIDGSEKPNEVGFSDGNSGYVAFHNLYKMLLRHKKAVSKGDLSPGDFGLTLIRKLPHPIVFFNYKDGNQYNVVIRDFVMQRSASDPMLYNYSISMRGYALTSVDAALVDEEEGQRLKDLGLDGVNGSSKLSEIKNMANSVKGVLSAAVGGLNVLGR